MFAKIVDAIQGGPETDSEDEDQDASHQTADARDSNEDGNGGTAAAPAAFNFWQMATSMADSVKRGTAEIATTVKTTDWRAELEAFGKDVMEETEELGNSAVHAVELAVDSVEQLPQQASDALPVLAQRQAAVQAQLGQVGHHLGRFSQGLVTGTHDLFEQVKDAIQTELVQAGESSSSRSRRGPRSSAAARGGSGAKYSRLDAEVAAMQRDSGTYCDEPTDAASYADWLKGFDLDAHKAQIEGIIKDNTFMAELQSRIVPLIVEYAVFWTRYFYRLHQLQQKHAQRQQLAQRAQLMTTEEVGWGDDEDDVKASPPSSASAPSTASMPTGTAPEAAGTPDENLTPRQPQSSAEAVSDGNGNKPPVGSREAAAVSTQAVPKPVGAATEGEARPQDADTRSADPGEVQTGSDGTDGAPGERWTVVGKRSSNSPVAAAESSTSPVEAAEPAVPVTPVIDVDPAHHRPLEAAPTAAVLAESGSSTTALDASPGKLASSEAKTQAKAASTEGSDDDLDDVEVPEDGGGSEVDEDWGAWD